jgi:hypothetical protein
MLFFNHKKLSCGELTTVARRISDQQGWPWIEPVQIQNGLFKWTVVTNCEKIGRNIRVVISKRTGQPTQWSFMSR